VAAAAAIEGRVTTTDGVPVEGARVHLLAGRTPAGDAATPDQRTTGRDGLFAFPDADAPATLQVEHPRYAPQTLDLTDAAAVEVTLTPRQEFFEEMIVTAGRERGGLEPGSVAVSLVSPDERPVPVGTVVELIQGSPSVAENGQGGRFQAYSIRGVAGQRVQSLVAGARIVTDRRAGATASFVDPLLLSQVDVVRGPYSSYYGSGALGGLTQAIPSRFTDTVVDVGYESQGDSRYARVGAGVGEWSLGLAYRGADDAETPDGSQLYSRFEQWSATVAGRFELGGGATGELMILPAIGRDIGKPNARFPARTTIYPEEDHLITRFTVTWPSSFRIDAWAHPNELRTLNLRAESRETVDNDAFDFGLNLQQELDLPAGWFAQLGLDYLGRRDVTGTEVLEDFETGEITETTTLDGEEDETAVYGSLRRGLGPVNVEFGARYTWQAQSNVGAPSTDDSALSGFGGLTVPLGGGLELAANLGSGLRFPGLSERFFSGATGRGEVFANPHLKPERSVSVDFGARWYGERVFVAAYVFRNEIDDYIEHVELATGVSTFENLTAGTIDGFEIEGFFQASEAWRLTWAGQTVEGRSDDDQPLADIAPDRVEAGASWLEGPWHAMARWQHRFAKDDPGPGEQTTDAAEVVSASFGYRLSNGPRITLSASNLLDEEYLPSADELSVPAAGRSVSLGLSWSL
jgi:iron complex outermembrane receptor protein